MVELPVVGDTPGAGPATTSPGGNVATPEPAPVEPVYSLASQGVFRTIQGEGVLIGTPMVFVRLARCPVGCPGCDTDYAPQENLSLGQLVDRISRSYYGSGVQWVWLTGGEPTLYDILALSKALRDSFLGIRIGVATSGIRHLREGRATGGVDFLSVSPHGPVHNWLQRSGTQLNVVPGLNGLRLDAWASVLDEVAGRFCHRFVTPLHGNEQSLRDCINWVNSHRGWRLGAQAHVDSWRIP